MNIIKILTVMIVVAMMAVIVGCGAKSPVTPGSTVVVNGQTAFVNMAVNFPPRTTTTALINPLISINTTKVNITVFAAGTNQILGSSLILAPASGGIASTSIPINGYAGPTYIDIKGYDSANGLTGYIRQNNVTITAGSITNVSATMVEFNQGVTVTGYNLLTPDNTALTLNNIYLAPDPNNHYFMGIKVTNASTAAVSYLNNTFNALDWASQSSIPMISDGLATFTIDIPNASGTIWHKYDFTLNFASGGNTPLISVVSKGLMNGAYTPAPVTTNNLNGIIWSGTQYLATGDNGMILTSPDAINWMTRTSGTFNHLQLGTWANGQFVVPGASGTILTSPDGITWTTQVSNTTNNLYSIAASGTQYVAVGGFGTILTSPNATTWTPAISPTTSDLYTVIAGPQYATAGVGMNISTSSDAVNWTNRAVNANVNMTGISYSSTLLKYVAVGVYMWFGNNSTVYTSPDSITWTWIGGYPAYQTLQGVTWSGSQFVAVGDWGTVLTSPDGVTWTWRSTGLSAHLLDITWTGTQFIAVGTGGAVIISPDGITWTIPPHPMPGAANLNLNLAWNNTIAPPPANVPVTVF